MTMISSPQEIEQVAVQIANWIAYNNRPFYINTQDGTRMVLTIMPEDEYNQRMGIATSRPHIEPTEEEKVE